MSRATRSQKRADSSFEKPSAAPKRTKATSTTSPKYVYIVIEEVQPAYGEDTTDIHGVFSDVEDANNCVKRIVDREYSGCDKEYCERSLKNGMVGWSCIDTGEGDHASLRVAKHILKKAGSEAQRGWDDEDEEEDQEGDEEEEEEQ